MMSPLHICIVKNTKTRIIRAMYTPADNWERQAAALVLAGFDDAVQRVDADQFAAPQEVGRLCAAWEKAVCA